MNSDQRLSYLHLMNKAAESEDRQSYFYYLKLAGLFSELQVIEIALSVFRLSSFVHQVQIAETLIAVHAWTGRELNNHLSQS